MCKHLSSVLSFQGYTPLLDRPSHSDSIASLLCYRSLYAFAQSSSRCTRDWSSRSELARLAFFLSSTALLHGRFTHAQIDARYDSCPKDAIQDSLTSTWPLLSLPNSCLNLVSPMFLAAVRRVVLMGPVVSIKRNGESSNFPFLGLSCRAWPSNVLCSFKLEIPPTSDLGCLSA